jgi:hypothetical protein
MVKWLCYLLIKPATNGQESKMDTNTNRQYEGDYAVYTSAGLIAFGVSLEHAREIANRIRVGSAKIATTSGRVIEVIRP